MIRFFKHLFLSNRFFILAMGIPVLFATGFSFPWMLGVSWLYAGGLALLTVFDTWNIFRKKELFEANRQLSRVLSLGSVNRVKLTILNLTSVSYRIDVIDELPFQLQERELNFKESIKANDTLTLKYKITPKVRGVYNFGMLHIYVKGRLGLVDRRVSLDLETDIAVYPSIIEMNKFELFGLTRISNLTGIKKIRRLGHSLEFEQIKNYVKGDDYQSVNWKATSRRNELMVNQYEDEKSQQVYLLLDKSRAMRMPFNGLSLLDYAINTSLVIANTALKKYDKVGLLSFSNEIETTLKTDKQRGHLKRILENLYREKESSLEANYELMYRMARKFIKGRSLLFLFTNFENLYALHRCLNVLRKLSKLHLLVVVIFENTEIVEYGKEDATDMEQVYFKTIAQKFTSEKHQIIKELTTYGIQTILSRPEDLTINSINKYLELKARGMI